MTCEHKTECKLDGGALLFSASLQNIILNAINII